MRTPVTISPLRCKVITGAQGGGGSAGGRARGFAKSMGTGADVAALGVAFTNVNENGAKSESAADGLGTISGSKASDEPLLDFGTGFKIEQNGYATVDFVVGFGGGHADGIAKASHFFYLTN